VLLTLLTRFSIDNTDIDNTGLVITEYLTNLIRHSDGEDKSVTLVISRGESSIKVELIDPTVSFHPSLTSQSTQLENPDELREGGMGLALIAHYFPDFNYFSQHKKNHFSFEIPINKNQVQVVLLDDERASLSLLEAYLVDQFHCESFSDEQLAYEYLSYHTVDLLLIDMNLNEMLGTEFLSSIKKFEHLLEMGIIVISSDDSQGSIHRANIVGVDDYLIKPVSKQTLNSVCERVIGRNISRHLSPPDNPSLQDQFQIGQLKGFAFGNIATGSGGDLLVHHKIDATRSIIMLGDVMGHGEWANKTALQTKSFFKGFCQAQYQGLSHFTNSFATALINQSFMQQSIITLIILEIEQHTISWINLGHPKPLLWQPQNGGQSLGTSQPLIGLSHNTYNTVDSCTLLEHDRFLIVTDGIFENQGKIFELDSFITDKIEQSSTFSSPSAVDIWQNCLPKLSRAIDDSSLLVLNK
jgi:sigma-B regulation protein RsbU (phosphoserine phosphatase)